MPKPEFANLEVEFWVHPEKVGFSGPSLCLFHPELDDGTPLLNAVVELQQETPPAQRVVSFVKCDHRRALTMLRLQVIPEREELLVMSIRRDAEMATIEMTQEGIGLMFEALTAWLAGAEDFGVAPHHSVKRAKELGKLDRESGELWFWGPGYAGP